MFFFKSATSSAESSKPDEIQHDLSHIDFDAEEPEADWERGGTPLYKLIEGRDWDKVVQHTRAHPEEARVWIYRVNPHNPDVLRWRLLPIHATCVFRSSLAVIEALVKAYPEGTKLKDDQEMLPVHLACRNGASKGVVQTLLAAYPESIHVRDRKGRTPLNLAGAAGHPNSQVVVQLLKAFQKDLEQKIEFPGRSRTLQQDKIHISKPNEVDYEHRTILFRLILKKDWDEALGRCESWPEEAATYIVTKGFHGNLRFLPIHKACVLQPPVQMIDALIAAYPDSAISKDQDGWLPIHCACFYGASVDILRSLLVANPNGAHAKDDEGRMPLHYATIKCASEDVVSLLLRSNPKASLSKDDEGRLPLHHACSKGAPDGTVDALLKVSPKGAQSKDDQGRLPLHHACRKNANERVILALLRIHPRGAQVKDDQEKLPLHYACQNGASENIIKYVLNAYPDGIYAKNGFGYTPLEEARAIGAQSIVDILEEFKAEFDKTKGDENRDDFTDDKLKAKVSTLSNRVEYLESLLNDVAKIGDELKTDSNNNNDSKKLKNLADKLSSIKKN